MAYNLGDLQAAVQDDLKDPGFATSRITRYLNYAQNAIFNTHMFKFCEKAYSGTIATGNYTTAQQTDHQATIGGVLYDPSNTSIQFTFDENTYIDHRDFFDSYPTPDLNPAGLPSYWTEYGTTIYFNCPLDKTYNFRQRYFRVPTALANLTDVPDVPQVFRDALELFADYRAEKYRGNHDVAATYKQDFEDVLENMALRYSEVQQVGPVVMRNARTRIA